MPDDLPSRIGSYDVRRVIGTGSMGVVYLGHDPAIDRPVAIKTIRRELLEAGAGEHGAAARFRLEAQAAGRLSHRNIVPVYQFGEDERGAYIVMEYVRGHSLSDYLRRPERLRRDEVLCLMLQLLDALHCAHESGVVHRDVKPANLMVDRDGRLRITDFGIARTESSQVTRVNAVIGSPGYMAPEQYTGGPLDRRVDVFSAGVLLYQMLTGSMPFAGTDEAIMYQIVYAPHESLVLRSGDPTLAMFGAIVDTALAKLPAQRFGTALEFRAALTVAAGGPVAERLAPERLMPPPSVDTPGGPSPGTPPSRGAGATAKPPSIPVPVPTGWDETQLAGLERELAAHVGPVAGVLVRRAARGQSDLSVVRQLVADAIVDPDVRERFLARTVHATRPGPALPSAGPASGTRNTGTRPTDPHAGTRLRPEDVDRAAAALTQQLGPIARLLATRCAEGAHTHEQFVACVLGQLAGPVDAQAVESNLWRSLKA